MGALSLLITGAAGYIGQAAVAEARRRGHKVHALVRPSSAPPQHWADDPEITLLRCDLADPTAELASVLSMIDCTIHCAAAMSGDANHHARDTDAATNALLNALPSEAKLVHVSSIAVHDFDALELGSIVTEDSPIETQPEMRDGYAAAKLAQEISIFEGAKSKDLRLTILRPGAVFGPNRLWNAHLGIALGPVLLRFGHRGQIPLAHIELTARALITAAERPATDPIMVVDDDLPDRVRYLRALRHGPKLIVPWPPFFLAPLQSAATRAARYKPLGFDNSRMRHMLDVHQSKGFELLMHEAQQ